MPASLQAAATNPRAPEPVAPRAAILLVNLGTPDAPTAPAVRRYLKQFLSDRRVVEIPRILWWPLLNGIILPLRSRRSAAKYAAVWMKEGSPLKVWTERQAKLLRGLLGSRDRPLPVDYAMRYGKPSIESALDRYRAEGFERVLLIPLYPQYSGATTASTVDALHAWTRGRRDLPDVRYVKDFHDDRDYIDALARRVVAAREREGLNVATDNVLVMSFHGIPQRSVQKGDPYQAQCLATAALLAERLGLREGQWAATFQSRFGKAEWLRPYTVDVLRELGARGASITICCPGFPADCLETLEEIDIEGRHAFAAAGGQGFLYVPCLNDDPRWIEALAAIAERQLSGWTA